MLEIAEAAEEAWLTAEGERKVLRCWNFRERSR
jgi:hypothetical protein